MVYLMAKLHTQKELPHMWTETLDDFIAIEDYVKQLEFENALLKEIIPEEVLSDS